jgi:hypothetical protein
METGWMLKLDTTYDIFDAIPKPIWKLNEE